MTSSVKIPMFIKRGPRGKIDLSESPPPPQPVEGTVPRVARLMAMAIQLDTALRSGTFSGYADIAQRGQITTARVSQILSLTNLAPDIQDAILHLPRTTKGEDAITEQGIRHICKELNWATQRELWQALVEKHRLNC